MGKKVKSKKNKEGVKDRLKGNPVEGYQNMILPGSALTLGDHSLHFVRNMDEIFKKAELELYGKPKGRGRRI